MLEPLRAWLNGTKDFNTGATLYEKLGSNVALKKLFRKDPTDFTRRKLQEELLCICQQLKSQSNDNPHVSADSNIISNTIAPASAGPGTEPHEEPRNDHHPPAVLQKTQQEKHPANSELYNAAKLQADKLYKETMNQRAVLFSLANTEDFTDPNTEAKINARAKLALDVVTGFNEASALFTKADYVKEHGRLPDQEDSRDENDYDHLPDHLVKQTLDNLRKNVNKMKKREQTPERVALQQKHEANIEKLLKRWHSLK